MAKKLILYVVILIFLSCNNAVESPYPDISFERVATMPGNGRSSAVAFSINGKGYVALGRDPNGTALKDCWEFDPTTSISWTEKNEFPSVGRVKAVAVVVGNKAYIGLGYDNTIGVYTDRNAYLKDFWEYDPSNNYTWTQKDSFPSFATDACVSFEYKGQIYIGAGFNGYGFTNEFWKYSPENDKWTRLNDIPVDGRAGAVLCKGENHIFFGTGYRTLNANDWWEYFPDTDSWAKRKSLPDNGRENAVGMTINDHYFVSTGKHFGGTLTTMHFFQDILEYDASRNVWYERGKLPAGGRENAISFILNGKGYIGFGDNDNHVFNDLWSFNPE
ncbi:MAG: kelch repeat-containing protein [Paludibacter sp.]|nr:kelch repeat-containing protein [Paludibacter sp.]